MNAFKLTVLLLLSTLFFPSLAIYVANSDSFSIDPIHLLFYLTLATTGLALLAWVLLLPLNNNGKLFGIASGAIIGTSVMALIQNNFLLWDFGPLDGRGMQWALWKNHAYIELVAWLAVPIVFATICAKNVDASKKLSNIFLLLCVALILSNLFSLEMDRPTNTPATKPTTQTDSAFIFHPERNTILLVLDTVQADIFHELMETHPEELEFLSDFIFFPNTLGGFPTTRASIPLIITGKMYQNDEPFNNWISKNIVGNTIIDFYKEQNFGINIIMNRVEGSIRHPQVDMAFAQDHGLRRELSRFLPVIDAGIFRSAPTLLKPHIYREGNWILTNTLKFENDPPGRHGADARFTRAFINGISTNSDNDGEFKLYHMRGAHPPLQVNEEFEFVENMPYTRQSWVLQTRGVLKNARTIIEALKSKEFYNKSTILIVGDHGTMSSPAKDLERKSGYPEEFSKGSARPLFLYKPATEAGSKLRVLNHPIHLADSACFLSQWEAFCDEGFKSLDTIPQKRTRKYSDYPWGKKFFGEKGVPIRNRLPPITNYLVTGDVRDPESWKLAPESVHWIGCNEAIELVNSDMDSTSNTEHGATAKKRYLSYGLSKKNQRNHEGNGDHVSLWFQFSANGCQPKAIKIHAPEFTAINRSAQTNTVLLNGVAVGVMQASHDNSKTEFHLPISGRSEIKEGKNILEFLISKPTSPSESVEINQKQKKWDLGISSIEFIE